MGNIWTTSPSPILFCFFFCGRGEEGEGVNLKKSWKNCEILQQLFFDHHLLVYLLCVLTLFLLFACSTYKGSPSHFLLYQSTNHLHTRPCHQNANYLVMIYFWNLKFALKVIIFSFDTFEITNVLLSFFFKLLSYRFHFLLHNF